MKDLVSEIQKLAVDAEFRHWCVSKEGKDYWSKFADATNGMNLVEFFAYCYPELNKENG